MTTLRTLLAAVALLACAAPDVHAQLSQLQPGQRVRILAPAQGFGYPVIAHVLEARSDTLIVDLSGTPRADLPPIEARIAVDGIADLEVSRGRRNQAVSGGMGMLIGSLAGFGVARLHRSLNIACGTDCPQGTSGPAYDDRITTGIIGAGAAIGLTVGVLTPGERWDTVRIGGVSVGRTATGEGELSVTLRF